MVPAMLGWLAILALAAWGARRFVAGYPRPPVPLRGLSARDYSTVAAAALATFPPGGAISPSGLEAGIPSYVDRFVSAQVPATRLLMRMLFVAIEHATIVFPAPGPGGRRRFSSLSGDQQVAALEGWRRSRLFPRRLAFTSLRAILTMGYFADPVVLRELGLTPRDLPPGTCSADLLWPRIGERPARVAAEHEEARR
jgi:Gluconate 2-dehydrogenase subunit 3